ncbi:hypothetical protein QFC21_005318 [Naganishia friedmannii]|uniref:Uncharacterized protein n=1 Tax=Naganishia friedmannii TaxID=89922 RepID=A0ACC2VAQ3_9TREE|nr:hypothetical protein QFC21_005318 [Naganishia friedmannii]
MNPALSSGACNSASSKLSKRQASPLEKSATAQPDAATSYRDPFLSASELDYSVIKPYVNPVDHRWLHPDIPASKRAGIAYFNVESDQEDQAGRELDGEAEEDDAWRLKTNRNLVLLRLKIVSEEPIRNRTRTRSRTRTQTTMNRMSKENQIKGKTKIHRKRYQDPQLDDLSKGKARWLIMTTGQGRRPDRSLSVSRSGPLDNGQATKPKPGERKLDHHRKVPLPTARSIAKASSSQDTLRFDHPRARTTRSTEKNTASTSASGSKTKGGGAENLDLKTTSAGTAAGTCTPKHPGFHLALPPSRPAKYQTQDPALNLKRRAVATSIPRLRHEPVLKPPYGITSSHSVSTPREINVKSVEGVGNRSDEEVQLTSETTRASRGLGVRDLLTRLLEVCRESFPPMTASQPTIQATSGALIQPFNFNHRTLMSSIMKWIIVSGLPFTTIENPHLQQAFLVANPAANLQSARTLGRRLEDIWDVVNDKVLNYYSGPPRNDLLLSRFLDRQRPEEFVLRYLQMLCLLDGSDMVGCLDHIWNIVVLKYLKCEAALDPSAYAYAPENVPEIRVMGETPFWAPDIEGRPNEDDAALLDETAVVDECEGYERQINVLDSLAEVDADEADENAEQGTSPIDLVHRLGVYLHSSSLRMDEFERVRAAKNPDTPKGLLPLKDVVTIWNSKEVAIKRVIRLRDTIEVYTTRTRYPKYPRFPPEVFSALETIQPTLKIFLDLTLIYSKVEAQSYRIIPDLVDAIDQMRQIHSHPSVSNARYQLSEAAIKKLEKYLKKFLKNQWVCAAMAPFNKTMQFLETRTQHYKKVLKRNSNDPTQRDIEIVKTVSQRNNKFASTRYEAGRQPITHNPDDPWDCYISGDSRFATYSGERVLNYWKRMAQETDIIPLFCAATDILGMASSSASVERLFSHAEHVLGKKRGSLSARLLAKHVMLRMWEKQGFLTMDDLGVN